MTEAELQALVGHRVIATFHYGHQFDDPHQNVPIGSTGTIIGYYHEAEGQIQGFHIQWNPPAEWPTLAAHWGRPEGMEEARDGWKLLAHLCAVCDEEAEESDYLCRSCRRRA
jgi:hypothetical protein